MNAPSVVLSVTHRVRLVYNTGVRSKDLSYAVGMSREHSASNHIYDETALHLTGDVLNIKPSLSQNNLFPGAHFTLGPPGGSGLLNCLPALLLNGTYRLRGSQTCQPLLDLGS